MILNRSNSSARISIFILDIVSTILAFAISLFLRIHIKTGGHIFQWNLEYYGYLFIVVILVWIILFRKHNPMPRLPDYNFKDVIYDLIKRVIFGTIIILSLTFLIKANIISRLFIIMFSLTNIIILIVERRLFFIYKRRQYRRGIDLTRVLVIGNNKESRRITRIIDSHLDWGLQFIKEIDPSDIQKGKFPEMIKTIHVDLVIFAVDKKDIYDLNHLMNELSQTGIRVMVSLKSILDYSDLFVELDSFYGYDLLVFSKTKSQPVAVYMKYVLDKIFALILLLLLSPLFLIISMLILISSGRPVFYRQKRVGLSGRQFDMYKFRSMEKDAEKKKSVYSHSNIMNGPVFKMINDPRITRLGRIIRRFSIDELPQIINVLKGEMSFVGPRPPVPCEVEKYKLWQRRRLSMRPGLTCIWQISGRNNVGFREWMYMDMEYIDHWSPLLDLIILIRTIPAVISGRGSL